MSFTKFYSLQSLVQHGRLAAVDKNIVSFDLFDTLLIRRVHDPDLLKLPVARFIAAKAAALGIRITWQKVLWHRNQIEARHRKLTSERFVDHEACYPRFISELLTLIFKEHVSDALLAEVTDYELSVENSMLVPRKELIDWLRELVHLGKRIFVLSDIYLPADHLAKLVDHAGFADCVEAIISSADTFLAKASGKAYEFVEKTYKLDRTSWLHIGDNPVSDGLRPSDFGIEALVLHDSREKFRKALAKRYYNYGVGRPFWRGRALLQLMMPHEGENIPREPLFREGYTFLAPLIGGFLQHLAEQAKKLQITKIFFLSREGYTFKKFWVLAMPDLFPEGNLPEIEYLYVSRMALAGASCAYQGLSPENASIAFLPHGNRDFRDLCRIFSLQPSLFKEHLARHQLSEDTCLSAAHAGYDIKNGVHFQELLEDDLFQEEVKRQTADMNTALQRYLEASGFFNHERVAIVDIGWLGTIQRFLYEAVEHRPDCPTFCGFLFGATRGITYPTTPKNFIEGVIYDRHKFNIAASSLLYARDLFEEACRAPHPTLNAYRLTEEGYELEFRHTDDAIGRAELEQDRYYASLQEGIFAAAKAYGAASALLGYSLDDYRPYFNYLMISKLAWPRTQEIANIRHKHHLDDFYGTHTPLKKWQGNLEGLWGCSLVQLRLDFTLRLRSLMRHFRDRINE